MRMSADGHLRKFLSWVKGANLGHRQNYRRVEAGKNAARPSYCSPRWTGLIEGRCQEGAGNRLAGGRTARNEARRHHAEGRKRLSLAMKKRWAERKKKDL
jgi:hypothetical protein